MTLPIYPTTLRGITWPVMKSPTFDTVVVTAPNGYEWRVPNMQNPRWNWTLTYDYLKDNQSDIVAPASPFTDYRYFQGFLLSLQGKYASFLFSDPSDNSAGANTWQPPLPPGLVGNFYPLNYIIIDPAGHAQKVTTPGVAGTSLPSFNDSGGTTADGAVIWSDQGAFTGSTAQTIPLVTDGTNYYSPLQRNFGGQFSEDITDLNTTVNPLRIWANGVLQNVGATCTGGTNYVLQPNPGLALPTASYMGLYVKWCAMPTAPITAAFNFYFRCRLESDSQDIEQFMQTVWTIGGSKSKNGQGYLKLMSARPNPL